MKALESARIAITHTMKKPLRTFLILQGIIWAVGIIVYPSAVRQGSKKNALENASKYGTDMITVEVEKKIDTKPLTLSDVDAIRRNFEPYKLFSTTPVRIQPANVVSDGKPVTTHLVATDSSSQKTRSFFVLKGRYINDKDIRKKRNICVLEAEIARNLFQKKNPIGETIAVSFPENKLNLKVVGVMEKISQERLNTDDFGFRKKDKLKLVEKIMFIFGIEAEGTRWKRTEQCIHIPISLLPRKDDAIDWIIAKADPIEVQNVSEDIQQFFFSRGKTTQIYFNWFLPILLGEQFRMRDQLIIAIFLVCLALGGIMIMNIMLMSVVERCREIAIRRVEGATRKDIIVQFLIEGILLCLIGAILGVPLGLALAMIPVYFGPIAVARMTFPVNTVIFAFIWAMGIGLLSAILPARRAARLDPVVVLQNE